MNQVTHVYETQAELNSAVKLWQKRLRLQDWTIRASFGRASSFNERGTLGLCGFNVQQSSAEITLLEVGDYEGDDNFIVRYDAEETLVHEMLHVVLARITPALPDTAEDDYEIAINRLAEALVKAFRS